MNGKQTYIKAAVLLLAVFSCFAALTGCKDKGPDYQVLVNKTHSISDDFAGTIELVEIKDVYGDDVQLEKKTCGAYLKLRDALLEEGIEIGIDSAYRSVEEQQAIMDEFTEKYGEEYAKKTVAIPGTSEHHTGLVTDIVPKINGEWVIENEDMIKQTEVFEKIHEKLPQFGFILRYPEGKDDITGYAYEPWHLRYVGEEAARKIYDQKITLEEYTDSLR